MIPAKILQALQSGDVEAAILDQGSLHIASGTLAQANERGMSFHRTSQQASQETPIESRAAWLRIANESYRISSMYALPETPRVKDTYILSVEA